MPCGAQGRPRLAQRLRVLSDPRRLGWHREAGTGTDAEVPAL